MGFGIAYHSKSGTRGSRISSPSRWHETCFEITRVGELQNNPPIDTYLRDLIMADVKDRVNSGIDNAAGKAKSFADQALHNAPNTVGQVVDAVKNNAQAVVDGVSHTATDVKDKVQAAAGDAAHRVEKWADDAYSATADTAKDFSKEMTQMIQKYPIQSVLIGLGVGLLLGRAARA